MQFKRIKAAVGREPLALKVDDKIIAWVLTTTNGKWTYDIVGMRHDHPTWMSKGLKDDNDFCMIPYEEAYDSEHEACMALLRVFGD